MSELRGLLDRAEQDGWNAGLAYRVARETQGHNYSVCAACGWAWAGVNRCVNDTCRAFCAWTETYGGEATSWIDGRPRMIGETKATTDAEDRVRRVVRSLR